MIIGMNTIVIVTVMMMIDLIVHDYRNEYDSNSNSNDDDRLDSDYRNEYDSNSNSNDDDRLDSDYRNEYDSNSNSNDDDRLDSDYRNEFVSLLPNFDNYKILPPCIYILNNNYLRFIILYKKYHLKLYIYIND